MSHHNFLSKHRLSSETKNFHTGLFWKKTFFMQPNFCLTQYANLKGRLGCKISTKLWPTHLHRSLPILFCILSFSTDKDSQELVVLQDEL